MASSTAAGADLMTNNISSLMAGTTNLMSATASLMSATASSNLPTTLANKTDTVTPELPGKDLWIIGLVFGLILIGGAFAAIILRWFGGDGLGASPYAEILFPGRKQQLDSKKAPKPITLHPTVSHRR